MQSDGAAAPPLFSGMCRGLVSLIPFRLFLSRLSLLFLFLVIDGRSFFFTTNYHGQNMAPFGS
jgi:hypothetical protein